MSDILRRTRPRSRGHVTCSMCGTRIPRGVRYDRIEIPDMGTIVTTLVCDDCAECASLCMGDAGLTLWEDGVTAEDIDEWARYSTDEAAARYLERRRLADTQTGEARS